MAWAMTPQCWAGGRDESPAQRVLRRTPVRRFFFHEVTRRTRRECISGGSIVVGTILRHVLSSCGVETPQDKDVKDDFSTHVLKDVAICSNTFWILGLAQKTNRLRFPFSVSWTSTENRNRKPAPRGIGGGVRREASIEGVRFRCRLQALSRLRALLTHRNLWHAGRRLKRAFRFRKVLWLLSSKESNNKNKHRTLFASRRGPRRPSFELVGGTEAPHNACCAGLLSIVSFSTKLHEGHEENASVAAALL
jgi:hypothetical protein